jgi:prepilin-type N-terminal cleavage/methylation domain-containing protein
MISPLHPRSAKSAFTLIELLVVIVIIVVLAALIFPISNIVLNQSRSTKCSSNLRQIGKAILTYCAEHDDTLPGPLKAEQYPNPSPGEKGSLAVILSPYLGTEDKRNKGGEASEEMNRTNHFLCPAYEQYFRQADGVVYLANMRKVKQYAQPAWGSETENQEPLKRSALTSWMDDSGEEDATGTSERPLDLSRVFALKDTDQADLPEKGVTPPDSKNMAPKPVHGDHRNALFFDFHVGKLDAKTNEPK